MWGIGIETNEKRRASGQSGDTWAFGHVGTHMRCDERAKKGSSETYARLVPKRIDSVIEMLKMCVTWRQNTSENTSE